MKLRLPNKLQAALVAALASVSFTTLSTGTMASAAITVTNHQGAITVDASKDYNKNGVVYNATSGVLTGSQFITSDSNAVLTFTLDNDKLKALTSDQKLVYVSISGANTTWGFYATGTSNSNKIVGLWNDAVWNKTSTDTTFFVSQDELTPLLQADGKSVLLTANLQSGSNGTRMFAGEGTTGTALYNRGNLTASNKTITKLTLNKDLITSFQYQGAVTTVSAGDWSKTYETVSTNAISSTKVDATLANNARLDVVGSNSVSNLNLNGGDIVIGGGSGQLFLQTWGGSDIELGNDLYIGSSQRDSRGAVRFGNDGGHTTRLNGTIYLTENSSFFADANENTANALYINGAVTDLVDKTRTGSTLTIMQGKLYHFQDMDLTGLTVNQNVVMDFGGTVELGQLSMGNGSQITVQGDNGAMTVGKLSGTGGTLRITNGSDLNITTGAGEASFGGTLTTDGKLVKSGAGTQTFSSDMSAINSKLTVNAGTLKFTHANGITVTELNGTGGTLAVAGNLTLSGAGAYSGTLDVGGQLIKSGTGTQSIGNYAPKHTILVQEGTLTLTGTYSLDALEHQTIDGGYVDAQGGANENGGFHQETTNFTVFQKEGSAVLNKDAATFTFTFGGSAKNIEVDDNGAGTLSGTDKSTLWVNKGTMNFSPYKEAAAGELTTVHLAGDTQVNMDAAATVGLTLAEGANATVNATAATTLSSISGLSGAEQVLTITGDNTVTLGSAVTGTGIEVTGGTLALGGASHSIDTLTVQNATVTTTHNDNDGAIRGDIVIKSGGTFKNTAGHDAFGWGNGYSNSTKSITLEGSADAAAQLILAGDNSSTTMGAVINMKGHAAISHQNGKAAFNFCGDQQHNIINVTGTDNTIDKFQIRENLAIAAESGAELTVGEMQAHNEGGKVLTKTGAGTVSFGSATMNALVHNAGVINFNTAATVNGNVDMASGAELNLNGATSISGNLTQAAGAVITNAGTLTFSSASTIRLADGGFVNTTGTVTFNAGNMFDLSRLTASEGTFTLFQGGTADLSQYGFTVQNIIYEGKDQYAWTFNANGTISYSTAKELYWVGGEAATEWKDGGAGWTYNSEPTLYVSSVDSNAHFAASDYKSVDVKTAITVGTMSVEDAYAINMSDAAAITATEIQVAAPEGSEATASLTINGTGTVTSTLGIHAGTNTVTLAKGVLLKSNAEGDSAVLAGSGTYALHNGTTALGNVTLGDAWTGTLKFSSVASFTNINLNTEDFKNTSAVEFDGVTGSWRSGTNEYTRQLILSGQGLTVSEGYSNGQYYFDGGVSGSGDMNFSRSSAVTQNLHFRKDISGWTGSLNVLNGFTVNANFFGQATDVYAGISRTGGTLNVNVGDGTNPYAATFHEAVTANTLTIKAQANATFEDTLSLVGALSLNGNSTATFEKAVSAASLAVGNNKSTGATVTFNGGLTLSGNLTLNGTQDVLASVALNGDTSVNNLDLSNGNQAHGTVTLASGKKLNVNSNMWMTKAATLVLKKNATFEMGTELSVVGLSDDSSVSNTTTTDKYSLNNSNYTLTNVQATINTNSTDVQLRFNNSKYVTSHNVTLKNLQSVFSGMDIQGGTTTVGASDLTADTTVNLGAVTLSGGKLTLANHVIGAVDSIAVAEGTTNTISGYKLDMGTAGAVALGGGSSLTLDGVTVDLTHMASEGEDVQTLVGGSDGAGKNGFVNLESKVRLFSYGADASVVLTNDPTFLRGVNTGSLTTEGDNKGLVTFNGTSYSAFYVNVPEITEHLASIVEAASAHGGLQAVYLNGGTLDADTDDKIAELHLMEGDGAQGSVALTGPTANFGAVTGAGILNVDGATTLNADSLLIGAGKTVTFAGSENINITSITNNGTLDIGAGAKVTTTATAMGGNGTSFVTTGEGTFVGNAFSLVGGTVSFGSDAQISGGDVLARSGELIIGGHTVIDGTLQGGDGSGKTARISVLEGGVLDVDTFNASWGWSSFTVDGVLNVADTMRLSTGGENYVVGGKGLVNTEKLTIQNVGKYFFDGTDGLTLQVGAGGITNGNNGSSLTLENGLRVLAGADMTVSKNATLVGNVIFDSNGNKMTISSILSGEGGLIKEGEGTLTLSGANTYTGVTVVKGGTLDIQGSISDNSKVKVEESANIAGRTENITVGIEAGKTATFTNEGGYTPKDSHVTFVNPGIGVVVSNLGDTEAVYSLANAQMAVYARRMVVDSTATGSVQVDNALAVHEITNNGSVALKLTSVTGSVLEDVTANAGDIEIDNLEAVQQLRTLSIASGLDVTFLQKPESPEAVAKEATVTIGGIAGLNEDGHAGTLYIRYDKENNRAGTLHANLELLSDSVWDLGGGYMYLGSDLTLSDNIWLDADTIRALDSMKVGETHWMVNAVNGTQIDYDDADVWYDSKFVRAAYDGGASLEGDFIIVQNNDGTKWGLKKESDTPEPTTGTLSLLALCALAARRRRK